MRFYTFFERKYIECDIVIMIGVRSSTMAMLCNTHTNDQMPVMVRTIGCKNPYPPAGGDSESSVLVLVIAGLYYVIYAYQTARTHGN